jgi:hypothetical protein
MNKYSLVKANRYNEIIDELGSIYKNTLKELEKQADSVKKYNFNKIPSSYFNIEKWSENHIKMGWTGSEEIAILPVIGDFIQDDPIGGFSIFTSDANKIHRYNIFEYRAKVYFSIEDSLNKLEKTINTLKDSYAANNESLNDYLLDDSLSKDEALFLLIGLNPQALINIPQEGSIDHCYNEMKPTLFEQYTHNLKEYRILDKAFQFESGLELFDYSTVKTKSFIRWSIEKHFIEEVKSINTDEFDIKSKDEDTGIPIKRLNVYKETLPIFLKKLKNPLSVRALTILADEYTDGKYTKEYKSRLGVGGSTIKKEITKIIKTYWWKNQPSEIQRKIKKK